MLAKTKQEMWPGSEGFRAGLRGPALGLRVLVCLYRQEHWGCWLWDQEAHTSRCQQVGRLGSRGSYWADQVPEPSCWKDPPPTYVYTYSHTQTSLRLTQTCLCLSALCVCIIRGGHAHTRAYPCLLGIHFSLTTTWTWQHGAAAASPLLGCWTWHDIFSSSIKHVFRQPCLAVRTNQHVIRSYTEERKKERQA